MNDTLTRVIECVAVTTRYPTELLTANADLENDLGIDSVKNLEVVLSLADEFKLDLAAQQRDPAVRTIKQVANWIDSLLSASSRRPQSLLAIDRIDRPTTPCEPSCESIATQRSEVASPHYSASSARVEPLSQTARSTYKPFEGRVAFVTGSGRGIGRTIARLLAARGAHVIVNSFHSRELGEKTAEEINQQGGKATHIWGSVANPSHVDRMFNQIEQQFGHLDMLVCNASDGRIGPFLELTSEDWERAFRTNVTGHYQCAVRASSLMRLNGGSIITISAVGANRFISGLGSQGVVKAAIESLTRYLACELGPIGIRVNCVAGGPVYGDLLSKFPSSQATQKHWEAMTPDGELCSPMDLANAIGFLLSDEARGITGTVMMVDHGFSATADGRPIGNVSQKYVRASAV